VIETWDFPKTGGWSSIDWSPDGKLLVAGAVIPGLVASYEIWRIPLGGGEPQITPLPYRCDSLRVHPDGRRLGLTLREISDEIWALENFLSSSPRETR
jgi:hypothetical protein